MPSRVTSRSNPLVRRARLLGEDGAARRREGVFLVEGIRLVEEAVAAAASFETIFHSPRLLASGRGRELLGRLARAQTPLVETTDSLLDTIVSAETGQGIVALARRTEPPAPSVPTGGDPFWVVAWGLQDPGNVGTLLRTAHAAGADRFLAVAGTADPTSPKAVRASAGSIFRIPVAHPLSPETVLDAAASGSLRLFGTAPEGGTPYDAADYTGPIGLVFGREGEGLPPRVLARLFATLTIPMAPGVESLNVAAAAAVVLFEAARNRARQRR